MAWLPSRPPTYIPGSVVYLLVVLFDSVISSGWPTSSLVYLLMYPVAAKSVTDRRGEQITP